MLIISGGVFGFVVLGYVVTVGQIAGRILTAQDIGHLMIGKDINGNPLSEVDKRVLISLLAIEGSMLTASSFIKLKLKYANKVNKIDEIGDVIEDLPKRPDWRQSELDAALDYSGYDFQKSFLNGEELPYGTKESSRLDYYKEEHSIEVKNCNIMDNNGKNNLINNVSKQIKDRTINLPKGTK